MGNTSDTGVGGGGGTGVSDDPGGALEKGDGLGGHPLVVVEHPQPHQGVRILVGGGGREGRTGLGLTSGRGGIGMTEMYYTF